MASGSGWGRDPPSSPGGSMMGCSAVQQVNEFRLWSVQPRKDNRLTRSINHINQAWRTLARCDGLCGLMLGQAVAMGGASPSDAGAVRAWLCSLVVWGPGQEVGWLL